MALIVHAGNGAGFERKTETINFHPDDFALIRLAAEAMGMAVSELIELAAYQYAHEIVHQRRSGLGCR
jgi:uncharacterized protein (DUF1778 family)